MERIEFLVFETTFGFGEQDNLSEFTEGVNFYPLLHDAIDKARNIGSFLLHTTQILMLQ